MRRHFVLFFLSLLWTKWEMQRTTNDARHIKLYELTRKRYKFFVFSFASSLAINAVVVDNQRWRHARKKSRYTSDFFSFSFFLRFFRQRSVFVHSIASGAFVYRLRKKMRQRTMMWLETRFSLLISMWAPTQMTALLQIIVFHSFLSYLFAHFFPLFPIPPKTLLS